MKRRDFLRIGAATSLVPAFSPLSMAVAECEYTEVAKSEVTKSAAWRQFELVYEIDLNVQGGAARLWLPLPQTPLSGYQQALAAEWSGNAHKAGFYHDAVYHAPLFYAEWRDDSGPRQVRVSTRVATRDRAIDPRGKIQEPVAAEDVALFLKPTPSMPIDGIVADTARKITFGLTDPLEKAQAIYDWIVDNTFRDPKVIGCGLGDISSMLETGDLGGKCADINALFVGLARAAGLPARDVYGIRVGDSTQFKSLGKSGDVSKAQHCRAEFHLAGVGWVPVDAADVRKAVLEEKLPLDDPRVEALRKRLFGYWEMNWVAFNSGRDLMLTPPCNEPLNYFMYPYAECAGGTRNRPQPDSVTVLDKAWLWTTKGGGPNSMDPGAFRYRITSRTI